MAYIFHIAGCSIFPTEVHKRIIRLIHIYLTLPLIRMNHFLLHIHFTGPKFNQIFTLGSATRRSSKQRSHLEIITIGTCDPEIVQVILPKYPDLFRL